MTRQREVSVVRPAGHITDTSLPLFAATAGVEESFFSSTPDRPRMHMIPKKPKPMFELQDQVPRLPVPPLEQVRRKYCDSYIGAAL